MCRVTHPIIAAINVSYIQASTTAAVQCRGSCLPPAPLRGGWPEDDTECPPLSTAGETSHPALSALAVSLTMKDVS